MKISFLLFGRRTERKRMSSYFTFSTFSFFPPPPAFLVERFEGRKRKAKIPTTFVGFVEHFFALSQLEERNNYIQPNLPHPKKGGRFSPVLFYMPQILTFLTTMEKDIDDYMTAQMPSLLSRIP